MTSTLLTVTVSQAACDIIGDVHGQADALFALMARAGWQIREHDTDGVLPIEAWHPEGRFLLFTGDLVNKGPDSLRVLRLAMGLTRRGQGASVRGNHEAMLLGALKAPKKRTKKSVRKTADEIRKRGFLFTAQVIAFLEGLPDQARIPLPDTHPMKGDGWLTVVHAACPVEHIDQTCPEARRRNVFGFTAKEEARLSRKGDFWARRYRGRRWIIYGHTPLKGLARTRRTLCLDAGAGEDSNLAMLRLDGGELMVQPIFLARRQKQKSAQKKRHFA